MKESKGAHVLAPTPPPLPPPPVKTPSRDLTSTNVRKSSVKNGQRKVLEASSGDPVSFLEKRSLTKIYDLREMSLARAMRALDALRKHTSTRAEIEELGASERLDVQVCNSYIVGVLVSCDARAPGGTRVSQGGLIICTNTCRYRP